jgi:hypothetical protein
MTFMNCYLGQRNGNEIPAVKIVSRHDFQLHFMAAIFLILHLCIKWKCDIMLKTNVSRQIWEDAWVDIMM